MRVLVQMRRRKLRARRVSERETNIKAVIFLVAAQFCVDLRASSQHCLQQRLRPCLQKQQSLEWVPLLLLLALRLLVLLRSFLSGLAVTRATAVQLSPISTALAAAAAVVAAAVSQLVCRSESTPRPAGR